MSFATVVDPIVVTLPVLSLATITMEEGHGGGCDDSDQEGGNLNPVTGTNQAESLVGTNGRDSLSGLNGNDSLLAYAGADQLFSGNGDDLLDAGAGKDYLYGSNGNDELRGGKGKDFLYGENGNDTLIGGCGPDLLDGGKGDDFLNGGNSPDILIGGLGRDTFVLSLPGGGEGHSGGEGHETETTDGEGHTEVDLILDFKPKVDFLALGPGLSFENLTFSVGSVSVDGSATDCTFVSSGEKVLAALCGVDLTLINSTSFVLI